MDTWLTTDACTMPTAARPLRLAELDALFASALTRITVGEDGVRMQLEGEAGLGERVLDLTARESACCSFFVFTVDGCDTEVQLSISVPPAQRDILAAVADRAAEVSGVAAGTA
jgi:hypothetical protein